VLTLHDCAFVDHPECFTRFFAAWYQWLLPRLARRVAHVLTVSEFSRQRIIERLRVAPERVTAIANGVDARFQPQSSAAVAAMRERLGLPERYVLSVGSLEPRKNLPRLLAAWQQVATSHDDVSLVLVGGSNSNTFRAAGLAAPPPRVLHAGYVAHDDLPLLYSGSTLFVYPSLYEGFGLPVLEAMACGAPVICSRTTALPEVAGDAARFVDPLDIEALAASLHELLSDPPGCAALAALGPARARLFTWEAAAQATAHQLERVALA
jgi:glycosyltransferase involved in cell wall biosynthesis